MIQINKYEPQVVEHFDPDENSLGFLNEYENLDLRCQIAENKADGYYLIFNGEKYPIQLDGKILNWPYDLYDTLSVLFSRLFKAQRNEEKNSK